MANWQGGSCPAIAGQIAGGFCTVTAASLKGFLPAELHTLKLELVDTRVSIDTAAGDVTVADTTPPAFLSATASPGCLWPPYHKYVRFTLGGEVHAETADVCDGSPTVRVKRVTASARVLSLKVALRACFVEMSASGRVPWSTRLNIGSRPSVSLNSFLFASAVSVHP